MDLNAKLDLLKSKIEESKLSLLKNSSKLASALPISQSKALPNKYKLNVANQGIVSSIPATNPNGKKKRPIAPGLFPLPNDKRSRLEAAKKIIKDFNKTKQKQKISAQKAAKAQRRKQVCLFFTRYGSCKFGDNCSFNHDASTVAICRKFILGKCTNSNCTLSHVIDAVTDVFD